MKTRDFISMAIGFALATAPVGAQTRAQPQPPAPPAADSERQQPTAGLILFYLAPIFLLLLTVGIGFLIGDEEGNSVSP